MKYRDFTKSIEKPYFSRHDLALRGISLYDAELSRWQKEGLLERIKRGLYVFADRKQYLTAEEVSALLYEPSYLSLESALSIYGLIPEGVPMQTAVTTRATRSFSNLFGNFSYRSVKPELFFGYRVKETRYAKFLLAEPEKALLDYFYLIRSAVDSEEDIEELRINCGVFLETIDGKKLRRYLKQFNSKKLERTAGLLFSLCSHTNS